MSRLIYWFRADLRLADSPALAAACRAATSLIPVYVNSPPDVSTRWGFARSSTQRQQYLSETLTALDAQLRALGSRLIILDGPAPEALATFVQAVQAERIVCETIAAPEEQEEVSQLRALGIKVQEHWQSTMFDPDALPFDIGSMPDVFTGFRQRIESNKCLVRTSIAQPKTLPPLPDTLKFNGLGIGAPHDRPTSIDFCPTSNAASTAAGTFANTSTSVSAGEQAALQYLAEYFSGSYASTYKLTRNQLSGTHFSTKFSLWLALGTVSAPTIIEHLRRYEAQHGANESTYWIWFELLWRDYFRFLHLKYGRALYTRHGLRKSDDGRILDELASLTTSGARTAFARWTEGNTRNSLVNAGMNELRATGWISNRMRQIVASYLIYDFKLDWRAGAAWFESQLLDYDVYSNQGNWLYIAGLGTDPRGGRRMNLDKQALEHDPEGNYRKYWTAT